jgi:hypothetical protein
MRTVPDSGSNILNSACRILDLPAPVLRVRRKTKREPDETNRNEEGKSTRWKVEAESKLQNYTITYHPTEQHIQRYKDYVKIII